MPAVSGTTGLSEEDVAKVNGLAKKIPIVMTPNMSVGVNLLFAVADEVARVLGDDFDVEIIEAHHNQKADAPSGTARRLLEIIARALRRDPKEVGVYGRQGMVGRRRRARSGSMRFGPAILSGSIRCCLPRRESGSSSSTG